MSLKVIFIAIMALLAVGQVRASSLSAVALEQLNYDTIGFKLTPTGTLGIISVTLKFDWAELSSDTNCIVAATGTEAAIPVGCSLNVQIYRSATAAYQPGTSAFENNDPLVPLKCGHTLNVVTCIATIPIGDTAATAGFLYGVVSGLVLKGVSTTAASYTASTNLDITPVASTAAIITKTPKTTGTLTVGAGLSIASGVAEDILVTFGNDAAPAGAITAGASDFIDVYLPGMEMAAGCIPTSPTAQPLSTTASDFTVTGAYLNKPLKVTSTVSAAGSTAAASWTWAKACGLKASAASNGVYYGYAVGRTSAYVINSVMKLTYTVHADMTTVINYKGTAATKAVANTVETNTGTFTFTVKANIDKADATKYNTMSIAATTSAKAGFNIGSGFSACTYTKNGTADTAYTYKTAVDADITAAKVIFRSAAAGGALAANDKIVVTCTNMKFLDTTSNAEWFTVLFKRDQTAATAGGEGLTGSFTARGYPLLPQSTATQVGRTDNAVKVMTKASSAALTSTATEGVIGAAEAGRWVNDTKDQVLEFSFTGLGTAITAGTAKTLTLTVPNAWAVDTTNTITTSTISVGGTDKTATYNWTATPTTVVLTPKTATDGAIAADAAVVLRFGNMKRTGAPVASSAKETFTFASASEVNTSTFYLPLANGMGMTGSTMKASIGGKKLTGSITGFLTAVTAGANTALVTPDTTSSYTFTTIANDCTGSLPAGKAITSTQTGGLAATLTLNASAAYDATAAKTSVLDFSCKLATVPTTFATGKTVAVQRATEETGSYVISEDKGSSAASASSTVGVVLGAVFGVVGLAQLTL